jgi:hypothetical protein
LVKAEITKIADRSPTRGLCETSLTFFALDLPCFALVEAAGASFALRGRKINNVWLYIAGVKESNET